MTNLERDILGTSVAPHSNWLWHKPLRLLIDAGEGLQLALHEHVWAPDFLALTHSHSDHILGLPGFITARRYGRGAPDKPLTILFPAGSEGVAAYRNLLGTLWSREQFPVTWLPMAPGDEFPIGNNRVLQAFASNHSRDQPTVGYRVFETRSRLRPEFAAFPHDTIRTMARERGRESLMENYRHILFAHTGDTMPLDPSLFSRADLLVHDATFLDEADRGYPTHATSGEALEIARAAEVRCLVLHHLSNRYTRADAMARLTAQAAESGFTGQCWLLNGSEFFDLLEFSTL